MNEELYKEYILDLYRHPLNQGSLPDPDVTITAYNPSCGDELTIDIDFDATGIISEITHRGQGCAISIAAVSLISELVKGKTKEAVSSLTFDDVQKELGINIGHTRESCAMLGLTTIQKAVLQKSSE